MPAGHGAVTGFEPVDILEGILMAVAQLEEGRHEVENQYVRSVRPCLAYANNPSTPTEPTSHVALARTRTNGLLASGAKCISHGSRRARQA